MLVRDCNDRERERKMQKKFEYKMRYVSAGAVMVVERGGGVWVQVRETGNSTTMGRSCGNNEIAYVNLMSLPTASAALLK